MRFSLGSKVLMAVFITVLATTAALGIVFSFQAKGELTKHSARDAEDFSEVVEQTLRTAMLDRAPQAVTRLVEDMETPSRVADIGIFDANERAVFATTDTEEVAADGRRALRDRVVIGNRVDVDGVPVYRIFKPIEAGEECLRCHQQEDPISGVIQMDVSLAREADHLKNVGNQGLILGAALVLLLAPLLWVVLRVVVVRPLREITGSAESLAAGNLDERVATKRRDEVGDLGEAFNRMAGELQARIGDLEDTQSKLTASVRRVAEALSSALDMENLAGILIDEAKDVSGSTYGAVLLVSGETLSAPGGSEKWARNLRGYVLRVESEPAVRVLHRPRDMEMEKLDVPEEWDTVILVPMVAEREMMGHLVLASENHLEPVASQLRALEFLGTQGGAAMIHSRMHREAQAMAITDGLTGVFDHRHFYELLGTEMTRATRYQFPLSLIILDVDNFKAYNDRYGHRAGDRMLERLGGILRSTARGPDVAARYGGEEFALLLPHTDAAEARAVAERVRVLVEAEAFVGEEGEQLGGPVTVSLGVASRLLDADTGEDLVAAADRAMYEAKRRGRNRVVLFSEMHEGE